MKMTAGGRIYTIISLSGHIVLKGVSDWGLDFTIGVFRGHIQINIGVFE